MNDLETELKELLRLSSEIGDLLRKMAPNVFQPQVEIALGGWHGNRSIKPKNVIVLIRTDTMRDMQASASTGQSTFNEINCRIHKDLGLTYDKWDHEDYYYQE